LRLATSSGNGWSLLGPEVRNCSRQDAKIAKVRKLEISEFFLAFLASWREIFRLPDAQRFA
jgi:hypothetical protein